MGDAELEEFYRTVFLPLVRRAAWKHRLSKEDAQDLVQDAFVIAVGKLDATKNPKAWLIQVLDLLCMNHKRKMARRHLLTAKWSLARDPDFCAGSKDSDEQP